MLTGGIFRGGRGRDYAEDLVGGTFRVGPGSDAVGLAIDGTFRGGGGSDRVIWCVDSPPPVLINVESVRDQPCDTFDL